MHIPSGVGRPGHLGIKNPKTLYTCSVDGGLLNEFAMMYHLRERFPLHYIIFKQTACHLPHEANVEQARRAWRSER